MGRRWIGGKKAVALILVIAATLGAMAATATAELTARGDLFVSFKGGISPDSLPRDSPAPITVAISGVVRTPPGTVPPPLRQIKVEINRNGHLDTVGLPLCHAEQIEGTTTAQALSICRNALVGTGSYVARTSFPEQVTFPGQGRLLAFNAKSEGRPIILVQVYGAEPVPGTSLITFYVHHRPHGTYGTLLSGTLPPALSNYGYVKRISLQLHRNFTYRGMPHSYLSAACAAPEGFPGADFPFAHASMTFEGNVTLSTTLTRSCRVSR